MNAPFNLLPQVLEVIENQRATATIIAPLWEGQVWFQKLTLLLIDEPIPLRSQNRPSHETGTFEKQRMASIRVMDMWRTRLRCLGWSKRASTQSSFSLAQSTLRTYNGYINKYISFCQSISKDFSDNSSTSVMAEFLCYMADHSDRPESMIKTCSAAVNYLFDALGKNSPVRNLDVQRLISGIIKSGTVLPMKHSQPMPIGPFIKLFHLWGTNEDIPLKNLRMKTVTLIALTCMTRPSDLAPKGIHLYPKDLSIHNIILSLDNIQFMPDNSLTIHFFGIKNDTSRS